MMSQTTSTAPATNAGVSPATAAASSSVGTVPARIITGGGILQVQVNGQWYEVEGVVAADLMTSDRRYAARVLFDTIGTISTVTAGVSTRRLVTRAPTTISRASSAPVRTTSIGVVTVGPNGKAVISAGDEAGSAAAPVAASTPAAT